MRAKQHVVFAGWHEELQGGVCACVAIGGAVWLTFLKFRVEAS